MFQDSLYELISQTSSNLPADVRQALQKARDSEFAGTRSSMALSVIEQNIKQATDDVLPLCQDTGLPTFKIKTPISFNQIELKNNIHQAITKATADGKLRTNSVDSLTGQNTGNNLGSGTPVIYFEQWQNPHEIEIKLLLKGGGCENKNIQYSLPSELEGLGKAGRDLDGIRKCILHSVYQAQGQGCSAGFIGVSVGGDRTSGYAHAKEQLFRSLDDQNPIPELAELESYIMEKANTLGIGTMGFGGEVTLLGCKIGLQNRIPASFFVSIAYNCWAFRRLGVVLDARTAQIKKWLYKEPSTQELSAQTPAVNTYQASTVNIQNSQNISVIDLTTPISSQAISALKVGDVVHVSGIIYTGRDAVHKHLYETRECPVDLRGNVIYHCGPVALKDDEQWQIKAAGPTTSIREEPYQGEIIKNFGLRAVIGKGGMGLKTLKALQENGAVYLNAIGGAAQFYARCIKKVKGVHFLNFGVPEAMWELEIENFPAIVTMDSHGNSLHRDIDLSSLDKLSTFREAVFR